MKSLSARFVVMFKRYPAGEMSHQCRRRLPVLAKLVEEDVSYATEHVVG